jgi:RNA polymerase sigma-70 factor (ECF subfamily)
MAAWTDDSRGGGAEPGSISSTLLEQVRARRPEAWRRLVDLYGPVVYRWCRQLGVDNADAADVVQDVFVAVAAGLGRFHHDKPGDSFAAWLRTITRNKVCDDFRRRQGQPEAEGGTNAYRQMLDLPQTGDASANRNAPSSSSLGGRDSSTDCLEVDKRFARRILDVVRAEFEPRTWEAFWRIVVDGQSPAEVADAMQLSLPAVYKAKSRVLQRLRRELKNVME